MAVLNEEGNLLKQPKFTPKGAILTGIQKNDKLNFLNYFKL
jgi:hypothetical protein